MAQEMVLVLLVQDDCLYLGDKHLKVGAGKLNAPGGKMEPEDEGDLKKTAVRETYQETGVIVKASDLKQVALLKIWREGIGLEFVVTVLMAKRFVLDELRGTAEMGRLEPYWFDQIDLQKLMPADKLWLPAVLFGLTVEVEFTYDRDRKEVTNFKMSQKTFV